MWLMELATNKSSKRIKRGIKKDKKSGISTQRIEDYQGFL
jgi:hypothetical protein